MRSISMCCACGSSRCSMETLAGSLAGVRQKYVLGVDPSKVRVDIQMQQPDSGLNLADYLEKKE